VKVVFACPQCDVPGQTAVDRPADWQCLACGYAQHLSQADPVLPACLVCGNGELFRKKNFPHGLGIGILVLGFVGFFVFQFWYLPWLAWSILIGTWLIDSVLYLLVGDVLVCYRCNAHYTGFPISRTHQPHELSIGERYRQERLRREQLKMGQ